MKVRTIRDYAQAFSGYAFSANDLVDVGHPVLKIGNIQNYHIEKETESFYNGEITEKIRKYQLQKEDFLIAMTGAGSVGRAGKMIDFEEGYLVNQRVAIIRPYIEKTDSRYLFYYFSMNYVEKYLYNLGIGAGQPNISANDILKTKVLFPELDKQRKIGEILSVYDELIENNNKRIKILEQMAENLYKEWFVRFRFPGHETTEFENGLPKGWLIEKVKNCVRRLPFNRLYKANELEKEGNVIVIDQSSDAYLGFHNNEPSHYADFCKPIILFGDHSCKFKLMCKSFSLGENVIPFSSKDETNINTFFLYYSVYKLITTEEYKRHWGRFVNMKILIPSIVLQNQFAKKVVVITQQIENLWVQNQNLIKQRDMLLPRLMSGKLEVN